MNNQVLERVFAFPYLGLTLDPELKFIDHRKNVVNNIRHKIYQLARVRDYVDRETALTVYKSYDFAFI